MIGRDGAAAIIGSLAEAAAAGSNALKLNIS